MDVTDTGPRRPVRFRIEWATDTYSRVHFAVTLLLGVCSRQEAMAYVDGSREIMNHVQATLAAYGDEESAWLVVRSKMATTEGGMREILDWLAELHSFELTAEPGGENPEILDDEFVEEMTKRGIAVVGIIPLFPPDCDQPADDTV